MHKIKVGRDEKGRKTYLYLYSMSIQLGGTLNRLGALNYASWPLVLVVAFTIQSPTRF